MLAVKSSNKSKELPLFAQLAVAVRCARRVVNLFRLQSNHPDLAACIKSLGMAIRLAESFASGNDVDVDDLAMADAGAHRAVVAARQMQPPNARSASAANAVYAAVCAVKAALETRGCESAAEAAERVVEAAKIARDAACSSDENVARSARLDWEMLHRMDLGHFPDFGEPFDASEKGPLGPLFQDFSRGVPSNTQPATGASERNKINPAATTRARPGKHLEFAGTPPAGAWAEQIEQRATELAARQEELDDREMELAKRHAALDEELRTQQQELTNSLLQLDAEKNATRAAFDALEEERREFLEQRLRWNPASPQS